VVGFVTTYSGVPLALGLAAASIHGAFGMLLLSVPVWMRMD